jgi:hypothetical protein
MVTDKIEVSEKAVAAIASSAERYIGYIYASVLPVVILAIENGAQVKQVVESLGGVLTAIAAFVVGIGIYTVYTRVLGALLLFPMQHLLHYVADRFVFRKAPTERTCSIWLMHAWGVPLKHCRAAYHKARYQFFQGQDQIEVQVSHGELHVLYLTGIWTATAFFFMQSKGLNPSSLYLYLCAAVSIAALIGDTRQHAAEAAYFKARIVEVKAFLKQEGLLN